MEDSVIKQRFDSEQRDSEFFLWNSEDIDLDDPMESPSERQSVYSFNSNPSILIHDKGQTRRDHFDSFNTTKNIKLESKMRAPILCKSKTCNEEGPIPSDFSFCLKQQAPRRSEQVLYKDIAASRKNSVAITQLSSLPKHI
ncbi:unnamed protein product [Moneuplotes crassus]|uniref:Uncharacterized protein n=1 Tax=Euplotes crassus TaxID=5936 RepID=A0AAD1UN92_EUPCR|nr:unnamed protein product [Moneuplotes crassus]